MRIPWELVASFALVLAAQRGVDVRIITPGIPDKKLIFSVTRSYYARLAAGGVLGALTLALVNVLGSLAGFSVEINPFTAMAVGFLGLPGAAMVVAMQLLL